VSGGRAVVPLGTRFLRSMRCTVRGQSLPCALLLFRMPGRRHIAGGPRPDPQMKVKLAEAARRRMRDRPDAHLAPRRILFFFTNHRTRGHIPTV
jgi:hypothetical protein